MRNAALAFLIIAIVNPCIAKYSGGSGDSNTPYQIATAADLNDIGNHPEDFNKCFIMTTDINLSQYTGTQFNIIGKSSSNAFKGTFNGNGYTIKNFTFLANLPSRVAIFGVVSGSGVIKNLNLRSVNIYRPGSGTISGIVGGLAGENYGLIEQCSSSGSVKGSYDIGGLVGANLGTISKSYSICSISGYLNVGGLAGYCESGAITNCYSRGNVLCGQSDETIGGLIGRNYQTTVSNCYSTGLVSGGVSTGGLIGSNIGGSITNSFWNWQTSNQETSAGGTPKTTAEMMQADTFTNWNFENIWKICETTNYPKLIWQIPAGNIICPDGVDIFDLAELCEQWLFEEIPADLAPPPAGDGIVNFADFSVFANQWGPTNDIVQLLDFTEQWLKTGLSRCSADISPLSDGDGRVNAADFAILANYWLEGL